MLKVLLIDLRNGDRYWMRATHMSIIGMQCRAVRQPPAQAPLYTCLMGVPGVHPEALGMRTTVVAQGRDELDLDFQALSPRAFVALADMVAKQAGFQYLEMYAWRRQEDAMPSNQTHWVEKLAA